MDKISLSFRQQRVVLFPIPFQGHINPMLQLANILHSNGFSITILHTKFNSGYTSNYPHFTFQPILDHHDNPKDSNLAKLASKGAGDMLSAIVLFNQYGADYLRQDLDQMIISSKQQQEPIVCLITDALWFFSQSVADSLNLPRIVLRTSSLLCLHVFASIPLLDDKGYFNQVNSLFDEENIDSDLKNIILASDENNFKKPESSKFVTDLEEQVLEIPVLKVKDISKMKIKGQADPSAKMLAKMVKETKAASGIIWNSFKELEEPELENIHKYFPIPSFLIGPFHKYFPASFSSLLEPDRSFMSWLDEQTPNSVLYISFGSAAQLEKQDFLEVAHGLAISKQRFLWVMRPGFVKDSEWIEMLPDGFMDLVGERGRIVKWAPQQEVLAHQATGAFWTHSGWNSTLESICEGVPMICSPFWGDQPLNARYVSDVLKVGVYMENGWAREEIGGVIRRVMVEEEREDFRERARCLKEKVNVSLMKGGSSYESLGSLVGYISSL